MIIKSLMMMMMMWVGAYEKYRGEEKFMQSFDG
jgi:hypothetical protein